MKKFFAVAVSSLMLFGTSMSMVGLASAEETAGLVPNFSDDFESYETDQYIETMDSFKANWSNNVMDGGEPVGMDSHCIEKAKIVTEEGTDNKVLYINNKEGANSFFYIAPKGDYRLKNFEASFRVKYLEDNTPVAERDGWFSLDCRKTESTWYTGCDSVLITLQRVSTNDFVPYVYRVMGGSTGNPKKNTMDLENEGYTLDSITYQGEESNTDVWHTIKYRVEDASYKVYVDDVLVVDYYYASRMLTTFGYVSLNACLGNFYLDDFTLVNLDTEAPPPLESEEPEEPKEEESSSIDSTVKDDVSVAEEESSGCGSSVALALPTAIVAVAAPFLFKKKED